MLTGRCTEWNRQSGVTLRERVLVIVNLIAKYVLAEGSAPINEQELIAELMSVGFAAEEIDDAFTWMESAAFNLPADQPAAEQLWKPSSYRVFNPEEQQALSLEARGFLIKLRAMAMVSDELYEEILSRAVSAAEDPLSLQEVKMVAAMTLLSRNDSIWQREVDCFMENDWARIYH